MVTPFAVGVDQVARRDAHPVDGHGHADVDDVERPVGRRHPEREEVEAEGADALHVAHGAVGDEPDRAEARADRRHHVAEVDGVGAAGLTSWKTRTAGFGAAASVSQSAMNGSRRRGWPGVMLSHVAVTA